RDKFLCVVKHDQIASRMNILQQSPVVGLQVLTNRIGASAAHDGIELPEVSTGQVVLVEQPDAHAELGDAGRNLVADSHDVTNFQAGSDVDVDAANEAPGRVVKITSLQVPMRDDVVSLAILPGAGRSNRLDGVASVGEGGNRYDKWKTSSFSGP